MRKAKRNMDTPSPQKEINAFYDFLSLIGAFTLGACEALGRFCFFMFDLLRHGLTPPYYALQLRRHLIEMSYFSLPVVALTALFTGMVLALQSYTGFSRFHGEQATATVVVLSMTRELGPVLAGLMVAGRLGAGMAAEIGTMRVTEQLDALTVMATNPMRYLIFPRLVAACLALPFLVLIADIIGIFGGTLVGVLKLGFSPTHYLSQTRTMLEMKDVISGLIKAVVFGFLIVLTGCYQGYISRGGAKGVGQATTKAVVSASISILIFNYLLTALLFDK